jgi:hypothetical protein
VNSAVVGRQAGLINTPALDVAVVAAPLLGSVGVGHSSRSGKQCSKGVHQAVDTYHMKCVKFVEGASHTLSIWADKEPAAATRCRVNVGHKLQAQKEGPHASVYLVSGQSAYLPTISTLPPSRLIA